MTATTRRLWLYGLLLLLPALCVGALAIGLLEREQRRLDEREQVARDTRRAAVETRARLIAENIELLLGDVQSTLMTTLREAPATEPRAFLSEWQATNPLVRDVFRATAEGHLVWGATGDTLRAWLAQGAPWHDTPARPAAPTALGAESERSKDVRSQSQQLGDAFITSGRGSVAVPEAASQARRDEELARRDISTNVVQYQRARQEIQEVAKVRNYGDVAAKSAASAVATSVAASAPMPAPAAAFPPGSAAPVVAPVAAAPSAFAGIAPPPQEDALAEKKADAFFATPAAEVLFEPITRSGWTPWRAADGLHLFGWRELPDRTVVGLELRLDAIKARLGEVFPATPEAGEAYALRDSGGDDWHQVGDAALPVALEVPLAAAALPGWRVAGAFAGMDPGSARGGFFVLGAALIALLVCAILGAGALLVRQARLSEAEAAQKTSFVANVSHELKTPLTTIRLYAELLAQGRVREESKRADYLATIGTETQRLARLVGNVLDFSRLEQGKKRYDRAEFDLAAELRRLAGMHGPRLVEAGLELRAELPATLIVNTDRDALEQIVLNLFDNACKYAAGGGEVLLALQTRSDGVAVRVADRGPGVATGERERIFEKFHRVDERLTAEKSGAGLGLSIARQLARGLGGDLRCEARAGGGVEFVLTLPGR